MMWSERVCLCVCCRQELHSTLLMLNKETLSAKAWCTNNWWFPRLRRTVIQIWPLLALFTAMLIWRSNPPHPHTHTLPPPPPPPYPIHIQELSGRLRVFVTSIASHFSMKLHICMQPHAAAVNCWLSRKFSLKLFKSIKDSDVWW